MILKRWVASFLWKHLAPENYGADNSAASAFKTFVARIVSIFISFRDEQQEITGGGVKIFPVIIF